MARDLFGDIDPTGSRITINRIPFTVVGVVSERGQGLDASNEDDQVYVPLDTAMHRLLNIDYFNAILFQIDSRSQMDDATEQSISCLENVIGMLRWGEMTLSYKAVRACSTLSSVHLHA
jgi:putative ABC transport system permease protein